MNPAGKAAKTFACFATLLGLTGPCRAASGGSLTPVETIPVAGAQLAALAEFPRCDLNGDIFVRQAHFYGAIQPSGFLEVTAEGQKTVGFSPSAITDPELKDASFRDFAVGLNGVVYALFETQKRHIYVAEFRENGQFYDATPLDSSGFVALHFAVFPSGEYLVAGVRPGPGGEGSGQPVTEIFDASGKMVKRVGVPGDSRLPRASVRGASALASSTATLVGLGATVPAEDGNIYLQRSGAMGAQVYVISPSGDVLRQFDLPAPMKDLHPGVLKVSSGRMVIDFFSLPKPNVVDLDNVKVMHVFSVFDAQSGQRIIDYGQSPQLVGSFACYGPNYFSFVEERGGRSYIVHAEAR